MDPEGPSSASFKVQPVSKRTHSPSLLGDRRVSSLLLED